MTELWLFFHTWPNAEGVPEAKILWRGALKKIRRSSEMFIQNLEVLDEKKEICSNRIEKGDKCSLLGGEIQK